MRKIIFTILILITMVTAIEVKAAGCTISGGCTGLTEVSNGAILIGPGTAGIRFATSSGLTFSTSTGVLTFTNGSTTMLTASNIYANSSAGIDIHSNNGTLIANFGAGGGTNASFTGGVTFPLGIWSSTGNVGIGTTSPYAKLSVVGETVSEYFTATSTTATSSFTNAIFGGTVGIGTTSPYAKLSVTNTGTGPSFIVEDSASPDSSPFIIDADGNIGIGTSSPARKLHLEGSGGSSIRIQRTDSVTANGSIEFTGNDSGVDAVISYNNSIGSALTFNTGGSGLSNTRMTIDSTGNVGIGTTSPYAKLSVTNTGTGPSFLVEDMASPDTSPFIIDASGSVGIGTATLTGKLNVEGGVVYINNDNTVSGTVFLNKRNALFDTGDTGTVGINIMGRTGQTADFFQIGSTTQVGDVFTVKSTGNVGIASTTPFATLAVNPIAGQASNQFVVGSSTATNFIIKNSGRVGVGTANPSASLTVQGTTGTIFNIISSAASNLFSIDNSTGNVVFQSTGGETQIGGGSGSRLSVSSLTTTKVAASISGIASQTADILQVNTTGDLSGNALVVKASGLVGLGTTSPYAKLSVVGETVSEYFTATSTTATSTFAGGLSAASSLYVLQSGNVGIGTTIPSADLTITNPGASDSFKVEDSATPDTTPFIIDSNGNVGIGTTSAALASLNITRTDASNVFYFARTAAASHALNFSGGRVNHITTSGGFNLGSSLDDATSKTMRFTMPNYDANTSGANCVLLGTAGATTNVLNMGGGSTQCFPATQLIFSIATSSKVTDGGTVTMLMDSFGRIGMGTQLPQAKLHVVGVATTTADTFSVASSTTASQFIVKYDGKVGIATGTPSGVLSVQGSVFLNGLTSSTAGNAVCQLTGGEIVNAGNTTCVTSSKRFKTDIEDIDIGLEEVLSMKPRSYTRLQPTPSMPTGNEVGFIAEEVNEIEPRLVEYEADGVTPRGVNYQTYTAVLTKAIQEQQKQIDELKAMKQGTAQADNKYQILLTIVLVGASAFLIGKFTNTLKK